LKKLWRQRLGQQLVEASLECAVSFDRLASELVFEISEGRDLGVEGDERGG
jgi:hypothetical protein